jgi:hypothetical protein
MVLYLLIDHPAERSTAPGDVVVTPPPQHQSATQDNLLPTTNVLSNPATTRENAISSAPEQTYAQVLEAWNDCAGRFGLSPSDSDQVARWLKRTLSRQHRRIDEASLTAFRASLDHFLSNSGADFNSTTRKEDALNLLRLCCEIGWSSTSDGRDIAPQYSALTAEILDHEQQGIEDSVPADRRSKWEPEIKATTARIRAKTGQHVQELCEDLLFPAFKEPLSDFTRSYTTKQMELWGIIPKYGAGQQMMQTRDEVFQRQLNEFVDDFDRFYTYTIATQQVTSSITGSKYWDRYEWEYEANRGLWPIRLTVRRPATTMPATQQGNP